MAPVRHAAAGAARRDRFAVGADAAQAGAARPGRGHGGPAAGGGRAGIRAGDARGAAGGRRRELNEMSRRDCWTNDSLRSDPRWMGVRRLAKAALAAFRWPEAEPPTDRSTYVRGRRTGEE